MLNTNQPDSETGLAHLIEKRRSIRSYLQKSPPDEWIEKLLHCARWAPSPSNRQPVRFILVESEDKKNCLKKALIDGKERLISMVDEKNCPKKLKNWIRYYFRHSEILFSAPWLFAAGLSDETNGFTQRLSNAGLIDENEASDSGDQMALGMALDNFMLKACELGLGSCVLTAPIVFLRHSGQWPVLPQINLKNFITAGFIDERPAIPSRKPIADIFSVI